MTNKYKNTNNFLIKTKNTLKKKENRLKTKNILNKINIKKKSFKHLIKENKIIKKTKTFFKLKKKWRFWRFFKKTFLFSKKITFFEKLNAYYNNKRIIYHQLNKIYSFKIKNLIFRQIMTEKNSRKFFFFFKKLESRLSILLLRSRFFYKLVNCFNAIKLNLITVNGLILNNIKFLVTPQDLVQKRRLKKHSKVSHLNRIKRLKWRSFRWKKARFLFWKIRRLSHFNLFWSKKQNTILNYLEINYKIPAFILLKQPFLKEILLLKQPKLMTNSLLKKIYFLY